MKYFIISLYAIWLTLSGFCGEHLINHVAEPGWKTQISIYNNTDVERHFTLVRYSDEGEETVYEQTQIPVRSVVTLDNEDFGYYGMAKIVTEEDPSPLAVKLSYQYGDTHSVCDFFIPDSMSEQDWVLTNPYLSHFDWFGIAAGNFSDHTVSLDLTAWKNGSAVHTVSRDIDSGEKLVDISSGIWEGLDYPDIDRVTVHSDEPISPPITITGNNAQDRHVFFPGQPDTVTDPPAEHVYHVHHVAEPVWTTTITIINTNGSDAHVSYSSWDNNGAQDANNVDVVVPAQGEAVLTAGTDFAYYSTLSLYTDDDISAKLSYRYSDSESVCEFFLNETESTSWMIPITTHEWMDWSGYAISNPKDNYMYVSLYFQSDENQNLAMIYIVNPHTKSVNLFSDIWDANQLPDETIDNINMVTIRCDIPVQAPITITGNTGQDRHIFFKGNADTMDSDFPDQAFKRYVLEHFDTDEDGSISTSEAEAVTSIDCSYISSSGDPRIGSLEGVQIFTNLEELISNDNHITWLPDLSSMSSLNHLEVVGNYILRVYGNELPSSLETVELYANLITKITDLDHLNNLKTLDLRYNYNVDLPDISALTQLRTLNVGYNRMSSIPGIEHCEALESLYFNNNLFTDCPDFSGLNQLRLLACNDNSLTSLADLSQLTELIMLKCQNNSITELNGLGSLSNLGLFMCFDNQLSHLNGLENCSSLFNFNCSGNPITDLPDLSSFPDMIYLTINNLTGLVNLDGINSCTDLEQLFAINTGISDFSELTGLSSLQYFHCSRSPVSNWPDFNTLTSLQDMGCFECGLTELPDITVCLELLNFNCAYNLLDSGDCPMIQAIQGMGLSSFNYNPQYGGENLNCD